MKIAQKTPEIYQDTERIQLISNFIASVLMGDFAPINLSDGSVMNLLDVRQHRWSSQCLDACGKDLETKLSSTLVYPRTAVGMIADYFVQRYGFNNQCHIVSFTGDNPSSYYALASDPKTVVISLGTSDTVMASIPAGEMPKQAFDGHLLVNPLTANPESNLLMLLLCFKNGSLVREPVHEEVSSTMIMKFFRRTFKDDSISMERINASTNWSRAPKFALCSKDHSSPNGSIWNERMSI